MLIAGPTSGYLSDRFGARWFATGGMLGAALSFVLLMLLPIDFSYRLFAAVLLLNGVSMGLFASPNRAAVMNSLPPQDRGAGGGMNQTFQNSAQVLSIGIFFTLMIVGLAAEPAARAVLRPAGPRRPGRHRPHAPRTAAGLDPVRRLPRLQPDRTSRRPARARPRCRRHNHAALDRALVLPAADLRAVPQRAARGVRVRDHRLPDRRRGVADAWRQVPARRERRASEATLRRSRCRRRREGDQSRYVTNSPGVARSGTRCCCTGVPRYSRPSGDSLLAEAEQLARVAAPPAAARCASSRRARARARRAGRCRRRRRVASRSSRSCAGSPLQLHADDDQRRRSVAA